MNGKYQGKEEDRRRLEEKDQGRRKEETRQNIGLKPISKFLKWLKSLKKCYLSLGHFNPTFCLENSTF